MERMGKNRDVREKQHYGFRLFIKPIFSQNVVLAKGLLIAPAVAMAYTLPNAVVLSIAFAIITFFTVVISAFIPQKVPYALRVICNVLLASLIFIPTAFLVGFIQPLSCLGIYLPLLVTNSLVVQKSETHFKRLRKKDMLIELMQHILGFSMVVCIIGLLREYLAQGTIWGIVVGLPLIPALSLPFMGFILVGLLAALLRAVNHKGCSK